MLCNAKPPLGPIAISCAHVLQEVASRGMRVHVCVNVCSFVQMESTVMPFWHLTGNTVTCLLNLSAVNQSFQTVATAANILVFIIMVSSEDPNYLRWSKSNHDDWKIIMS